MRESIKAIASVFVLTLIPASWVSLSPLEDESAAAVIPEVTITLPPVTVTDIITVKAPPVTVTAPGTTKTVPGPTVRLPAPTRTVIVPGKESTVISPGPTVTLSARPQATVTVTESPAPAFTTVGQEPSEDGTVESNRDEGDIDFGDGDTTVEEIVVIGVSLLVALISILIALWVGYAVGYKDSERKQRPLMDDMLDKVRSLNKR